MHLLSGLKGSVQARAEAKGAGRERREGLCLLEREGGRGEIVKECNIPRSMRLESAN